MDKIVIIKTFTYPQELYVIREKSAVNANNYKNMQTNCYI